MLLQRPHGRVPRQRPGAPSSSSGMRRLSRAVNAASQVMTPQPAKIRTGNQPATPTHSGPSEEGTADVAVDHRWLLRRRIRQDRIRRLTDKH
jgi:hypothetical protein